MKLGASSYSRRKILRRMVQGIGGLWAAPLVASCSEEPLPSLRVGANQWLGYEPLYVARESGDLDGSHVALVEFTAASAVMRALRNGNVEVAAVTADEAIEMMASGFDLRILWPLDFSNGGDSWIMRPEVPVEAPWSGKRIGMEAGAVGGYMLYRACEALRIPSVELTIVPLPAGEHERAFLEGRVDGVITFEPMRSHLLRAGGREVFSSRAIPHDIVDVFVAPQAVIDTRMDDLQDLARAWFRGRDRVLNPTPQVVTHLQRRQNMAEQEVLTALQGINFPDRTQAQAWMLDPRDGLETTLSRVSSYLLDVRGVSLHDNGHSLLDKTMTTALLGKGS